MNRIIVMFEDEDRELNMSLYNFVAEQYRHANPFLVCHVTSEEYRIMQKQIRKGCLSERLSRIVREDIGYDKFRYLMAYDRYRNNISIADYNDFNRIGNYVIDDKGIHYNESGRQFPEDLSVSRRVGSGLKVYTTESYKDVIEHYEDLEEWIKHDIAF